MSRVLLLGGQAESLLNFRGTLIAEMVAAGHEVIAAAPDISPQVAQGLRALGATPEQAPLSRTAMNPIEDFKSTLALWRLMRRTRPDVVLPYTIKPVIFGSIAARLAGVKRITAMITGLGYAFIDGEERKRKLARRMAILLYRSALPLCSKVLFQNPDDRQVFYDLGILSRRANTAIINGSGVDITHFAVRPLPDHPRFLMIARFLIDKGIREYAEAAKAVLARYPQARIALAGFLDSSPNSIRQEELEEWQKAGIAYVGRLSDVRDEIAASSVVVLPSYREGTPRTVLEAMAMGRAIITTDAPGCRETVQPGVNGVLVPVRDAAALAQAMLAFQDAPEDAARMGANSRQLCEERYDARKVAQDIMRHAGLSPA